MRILTSGLQIFVFVASLAASEYLIYPWAPPPPEIGTRFLSFKRVKDEVTILFIGSSYTDRQVVPPIVDRTFEQTGSTQLTFNLGIRGASNHEINSLLRKVLALEPKRLKLVVLEERTWASHAPENIAKTHKFAWWHDPKETVSVLRTLSISDFSGELKATYARRHISAMFRRCLNIGMLIDIPDRFLAGRDIYGWVPLLSAPRTEKTYDETISETYFSAKPPVPTLSGLNLTAYIRRNESIREKGIEQVSLLPPSFEHYDAIHLLHGKGMVPNLIDLSSPFEYPELFESKVRLLDGRHLNAQGSELYSRIVAEEIFRLLPSI